MKNQDGDQRQHSREDNSVASILPMSMTVANRMMATTVCMNYSSSTVVAFGNY